MIQVTEKYCINVCPECYAVGVKSGTDKRNGREVYQYLYFYATLEGALIKISSMIEKSNLKACEELREAVKIIAEVHKDTDNIIRQAVKAAKFPEK